MSFVINPLTGRQIRVGGATYNKVMTMIPKQRVAGGLMVDLEHYHPRREQRVKRAIINRSLRSHSPVVRQGAKRSYRKQYEERKSPNMSATLFTPGTHRKGNDKKWWKIAVTSKGVHRWIRV